MTSATPHNRIIATAAREILRPMGLAQQGRSRLWLDDHGWWLGVVEFQPSSWSRGSYLNVGVMWLWQPGDKHPVYFDLGHRIEGFVAFEDEAQFQAEARRLAQRAADEIERFRSLLPTVAAAAAVLQQEAKTRQGWPVWYAGMALALAGDPEEAAKCFKRVCDDNDERDWWRPVKEASQRFCELVRTDPDAVTAEARNWIDAYRRSLGLPPRDALPLSGR